MVVGYTNPGYPVARTILNCCEGVRYVRSRSFESAIAKMRKRLKLPNRGLLKTGCTYLGGAADSRVDLFHFFNLLGCGLCKKPYVTTFETSVPRGLNAEDYWFKRGLESLLSNRCRKLLAISDCARRIQVDVLRRHLSTTDAAIVENKIEVVSPPQELISRGRDECVRQSSGSFRAIFVGKDFFRKGGGEVVRTFVKLREDYPVELWVVGDLARHGYASDAKVDDSSACQRLIESNSDWIHWSPSLPNAKVLELMRTCDIGLLPTRADTYGYSVLEMQACGLPVVTTDVRALPEINNDECGWVIRGCGKRDGTGTFGEANYSSCEKLRELSEIIENGLHEKMVDALTARESVLQKGGCARKRIENEHSPVEYSRRLLSVYESALSVA